MRGFGAAVIVLIVGGRLVSTGDLDAVRAAQTTRAQQDGYLIRLAVDLAAEREPAPIALGPDAANPLALAYERFTRAHLAAIAAVKGGKPLDPLNPPRVHFINPLVVIALPLTCGDRTVRPVDVELWAGPTQISRWLPVSGTALQKLLPGVAAPAGAIAVQFNDTELRNGRSVRISYAAATCASAERQVSIPIATTDPRIVQRAMIEMPPDVSAPQPSIELTLSGAIDLDGRLRYASAPEATTPFGKMALEAAKKMKFEPARVNGSPVPWTAGVIVTFGAGR